MPDLRKSIFGLIAFFLFFFPGRCLSQESDNTEIYLYEYREGFFNIPFYLDTLSIKDSFHFHSNDYTESRSVYFNYGPYRCYFYAEPDKSYKVFLPDLSSADIQWKQNPYFEYINLHCKIETMDTVTSGKELNAAIRDFDQQYEPFLSRQALRYYNVEYAKNQLDSFISVAFPDIEVSDPEYFNLYRDYKKALLYYHTRQLELDSLIHEFIINKPISFNIPSYRLFFSLTLSNYFDFLMRNDDFKNIYFKFSRLSVPELMSYLENDSLLKNDTLREMILLKECYNAWYTNKFEKKRILTITDTIKFLTQHEAIKQTASFLKQKFTFLQPGYPAVEIHSTDLQGDSVIINKENPKLVYLGFCDLNNLECIKEIEFLKYLQAKHEQYIEIVTVLKSESKEQLFSLSENNRVSWQIINWDEWPGIARDYQVKGVPAFFLIDKDGKIIQNPARNPSDNFEYELFMILRARGEV